MEYDLALSWLFRPLEHRDINLLTYLLTYLLSVTLHSVFCYFFQVYINDGERQSIFYFTIKLTISALVHYRHRFITNENYIFN